MLALDLSLLIILIIGVLCVMAWLIFRVNRLSAQSKILSSQVTALEMLNSDMQINFSSLQQNYNELKQLLEVSNLENEQVSKQLEHRVKNVQQELTGLGQQVTQLNEHQPQDKFYHRANKLAAKGASAEEIMAECELPRAEVEMLLAIYRQGFEE